MPGKFNIQERMVSKESDKHVHGKLMKLKNKVELKSLTTIVQKSRGGD